MTATRYSMDEQTRSHLVAWCERSGPTADPFDSFSAIVGFLLQFEQIEASELLERSTWLGIYDLATRVL